MEKLFNKFSFCFQLIAAFALMAIGGGAEVLMAATAPLAGGNDTTDVQQDLGTSMEGDVDTINKDEAGGASTPNPYGNEGIATETVGREQMADEPDFYTDALEEGILKIRPHKAPLDQISRYATSKQVNSQVVRYYSEGTRPVLTTIATAVSASTNNQTTIDFTDCSIFTQDDEMIVLGVSALYNKDGVSYASLVSSNKMKQTQVPYLQLHVVGNDDTNGKVIVYAVNGNPVNSDTSKPYCVPVIAKDTKVLRLAKANGELDVQTGRFTNYPKSDVQYCQNFMIQIEESEFNKKAGKKVNINFSDMEEDALYDFRRTREFTSLLGDLSYHKHPSKNGMGVRTTKGLWYIPTKDIYVGTEETNAAGVSTGNIVITDDDLVDITKTLFVGNDAGDGTKIFLCGSEMLAAFSKIRSKKFIYKDSFEQWDLKFKKWETEFGTVLTIHCEVLDEVGLENAAFALDPEYLGRREFISLHRNVLDLKTAGVRNTDAVVYQEVSCLILRYPSAHARIWLNKATSTTTSGN